MNATTTQNQPPQNSRMNEQELHDALAQLSETHPALLAVRQIIAEKIENATAQVSSPELAERPGLLAHTAGGLEWLRYLAQEIEEIRHGERAFERPA